MCSCRRRACSGPRRSGVDLQTASRFSRYSRCWPSSVHRFDGVVADQANCTHISMSRTHAVFGVVVIGHRSRLQCGEGYGCAAESVQVEGGAAVSQCHDHRCTAASALQPEVHGEDYQQAGAPTHPPTHPRCKHNAENWQLPLISFQFMSLDHGSPHYECPRVSLDGAGLQVLRNTPGHGHWHPCHVLQQPQGFHRSAALPATL